MSIFCNECSTSPCFNATTNKAQAPGASADLPCLPRHSAPGSCTSTRQAPVPGVICVASAVLSRWVLVRVLAASQTRNSFLSLKSNKNPNKHLARKCRTGHTDHIWDGCLLGACGVKKHPRTSTRHESCSQATVPTPKPRIVYIRDLAC